MVASAFPNATEAGARMLALGGNAVDADMRYNDGFLRADELALIPWPIVRRALRRRYRSITLATMPPPGAGRVLLLVMMMLIHLRSDALEQVNPENLHFFAESLRKAFLRRVDRPFDPNTYAQVQNKVLLSRLYARGLADSIRDDVDPTLPTVDPEVDEFGETTHFSVMDADGNAVAVTRSIAPRLHCSIGGQVSLDAERFDPAVISRLQDASYRVAELEPYAFYLGCVPAVLRRQAGLGIRAPPTHSATAAPPARASSRSQCDLAGPAFDPA